VAIRNNNAPNEQERQFGVPGGSALSPARCKSLLQSSLRNRLCPAGFNGLRKMSNAFMLVPEIFRESLKAFFLEEMRN
jgi:hypothetical protein